MKSKTCIARFNLSEEHICTIQSKGRVLLLGYFNAMLGSTFGEASCNSKVNLLIELFKICYLMICIKWKNNAE